MLTMMLLGAAVVVAPASGDVISGLIVARTNPPRTANRRSELNMTENSSFHTTLAKPPFHPSCDTAQSPLPHQRGLRISFSHASGSKRAGTYPVSVTCTPSRGLRALVGTVVAISLVALDCAEGAPAASAATTHSSAN